MGKITLAIDASRAITPEPTGVENYSREIIKAMLDLPAAKNYNWILLSPEMPNADHPLSALPSYARWEIIPGKRLWTILHLSKFINDHRDLQQATLFVPGHILPLITPQKSVVTIHDFAFRRYPELYGIRTAYVMDSGIRHSAKRAQKIIVPSEATADDLKHYYGTDPQKIIVIPHGINEQEFAPANHKPVVPKAIHEKQPYFLVIGRLERRKNTANIVRAFDQLLNSSAVQPHLVFIGKKGKYAQEILEQIKRLPPKIRKNIHCLGHVAQTETVTWLRHASALVYPSQYEGFGLPILEGMAANTPVITSNRSSLPEVAGDAAHIVDPENVSQLAQAMNKILSDKRYADQLRKAGRKRIKNFSWQAAAQKTLETLVSLA